MDGWPRDRANGNLPYEAGKAVAHGLPKAGDCVIFLSHIPHQGAKEDDSVERSNVVCHYQLTPMYEGTWFVSRDRGYEGTSPFATDARPENVHAKA
jgi:hypothetical protein